MIVIGVDVHKHSLSAVAVDEVGRQLDCVETSDAAELVPGRGGLVARITPTSVAMTPTTNTRSPTTISTLDSVPGAMAVFMARAYAASASIRFGEIPSY